ncbi:hypothetical protein XENORESO_015486 [Xenotaenia resolanae]|uniref:Uncharacterized protein n=1 Tax=Xenotaenia resolanae TaxID=208358 RepID=A0ABV0VPJ5_9TELE
MFNMKVLKVMKHVFRSCSVLQSVLHRLHNVLQVFRALYISSCCYVVSSRWRGYSVCCTSLPSIMQVLHWVLQVLQYLLRSYVVHGSCNITCCLRYSMFLRWYCTFGLFKS